MTTTNTGGEQPLDYRKLSGPELLDECRNDVGKWAKAFCQHNPHATFEQVLPWFHMAGQPQQWSDGWDDRRKESFHWKEVSVRDICNDL